LMAAVYVALGSVAYRRAQEDSYLFLVFLGLGLTCLTIAIPIQLKQNWITVGWSVEAAVLTWVGFHLDSSKTRRAALLIVAMVVFRLLFLDSSFSGAFTDDLRFCSTREEWHSQQRSCLFLRWPIFIIATARSWQRWNAG
jgi:hypothetical protein